MFFSLPTIALAASLLSSSGVLAIPHNGHRHLHAAKRDAVLAERKVTVVETVTDWVTVWWDGTSYITTHTSSAPSTTSANAINTQAAADAANVDAAAKAKAAAAQAPAPVTTPVPVATVAPAAPAAPAVAVADTAAADAAAAAEVASKAAASSSANAAASSAASAAAEASANAAANAAASVASNAANAAAATAKNPDGIIAGVVSAVSSIVAPIIATPTPVVTPSTSGPKRGLAYNNADLTNSFTGADSKVSWAYNWGSTTPSIPSSFEYVPMLWGTQAVHSDNWNEAATAAIAKGSKHLLAFNEPDLPAQSNLDPGAAAAGYKTFMQPFAGKAKLGSPAVTNGPAPMGIAYYQSFMAACDGCTVDFIPLHWYDAASNVVGFKQHISDMNDVAGGRKLWITEFGASGSTEEQEEFLRQVIPWLDGQDYVERYAYFYADGVLTQNNAVSALGNVFMSFVS
ncbi:hypothetical protein V502_07624 [Pseudogymnoascus sp. VKM F-4520 (FW-2644)]|nr:hypothetical protein V502_07624 [Pseudogymnoascus sp. VKM F-4520 (FW-2644)]